MSGTPTAYHAFNLFSLTMESRYGVSWRSSAEPQIICMLADEIARGFGGKAEAAPRMSGGHDHTLWRFPDGSAVRTGPCGLRREGRTEQAA